MGSGAGRMVRWAVKDGPVQGDATAAGTDASVTYALWGPWAEGRL